MASEYIGANRGADLSPDKLTVGSSTGSTDIELRVDLTKSLTAQDVQLFLEALQRFFADARVTAAFFTSI